MNSRTKKLTKELEELSDAQARIDAIEADLISGKHKYKSIDSCELAKLVGLDLDDVEDWGQEFYAYRVDITEYSDQPYADHLDYLKDGVSSDRYKELKSMAEEVLREGEGDIEITPAERKFLEENYTRKEHNTTSLVTGCMELEASNGNAIEFLGYIEDGSYIYELFGPYELANDSWAELDDYVSIE